MSMTYYGETKFRVDEALRKVVDRPVNLGMTRIK